MTLKMNLKKINCIMQTFYQKNLTLGGGVITLK